MANPGIGEVAIEIGDQRFRYVLGFYGLAALERRLQMPWPQIIRRAVDGSWGANEILAMFHAGLLQHHEQITEKQAAALLDQCGIEYIVGKIAEGIRLTLPSDGGLPTKPNGGVGTAPIATG
jgi:Phage tail tube protein, GTA-gp10